MLLVGRGDYKLVTSDTMSAHVSLLVAAYLHYEVAAESQDQNSRHDLASAAFDPRFQGMNAAWQRWKLGHV